MNIITSQPKDAIQDTKKCIVDTARGLFSEFTYLGVSMDDIAKKLNIAKASLYYHFTGKTEIYEKVLDEVFDDLNLAIDEAMSEISINKKLYKLIKNYLEFGFKEKNIIKAIVLKLSPADEQITKHIAKLRDNIAKSIQPLIDDVLASKNLANKVDSRLLTSMLTGMMDGLLLEYSFLNKKINSAKVSDQIIAVLF